jgi:hypothetical protein
MTVSKLDLAKLALGHALGVSQTNRPKLSNAAQAIADYCGHPEVEHEPNSPAANLAAALAGEASTRTKPVASKPSAEMQAAVDRAVAESLARRGLR